MAVCCDLIRGYSENLWNYITTVYSYKNMRISEIGITDDLVFKIVDFYANYPGFCDVYVNHAYNEAQSGADIDLVILDTPSTGYEFFIQSKIMNNRGNYYDIKRWNFSSTPQYQKLINWASINNGYPLYLLYNGKTGRSTMGSPDNGLSVVNASIIRDYRFGQYNEINGFDQNVNLFSFDFLWVDMIPFHFLFCDRYDSIRNSYFQNGPKNIDDLDIRPPFYKVEKGIDDVYDNDFSKERLDEKKNFVKYKIIIKKYHSFIK